MSPDTLYIVIAIIVGLCTLVGMFVGFARWLGRVDRNTEATDRLTTAFEKFSDKTGSALLNHEKRITRLEAHDEQA
jgi:hypothetical protein